MSARVFKDTDFLDAAPSVRTFSEDDFTDTPAESPRYFTNPADQAIAETPVVRQAFRGAANTLDTMKSMALRGKAVFNSAIDDRGGAYDALQQADAIDAEKARREEQFQKTSGTAGNIGAGVVESLTLAAPAAMMGGAPAAIGVASASQGNQAYYEGKKAGLTGTDLAQHVAMQTLLEGAPAAMSQVAGVGGLEKRLAALGEPVQRGIKAALARFGKTSLEELPEELVTTLTQQIAGAQAGIGTATPDDLANGAFQTTLQTLATAGLVESPSIARGAVDAMRRPPTPPSSDAPANAAPTGDMNLTLTPEQPVTQSDVADIFAMFDEPAAQPAAEAPTAPVARQTPDTLPPLPPGATIPVQGTTAPRAQQPAVAPIAPGSAVMRPVPTLTPEEVQAWSEEADALAPGEQEIVADYLMQNPGNPEQLSPREIVARGKRDVWRMTPEEQAQYEQAMGLNEQPAEATAPAQPQETANEEVQGQGRQEEVAAPAKQPWEMTRVEWAEAGNEPDNWASVVRRNQGYGKPIPPAVAKELADYDAKRTAPEVAETPAPKKGDTVVRYTHKDGTGLLNNGGLDRSKLTDEEDAELVTLMDLGLRQPPSGTSGTFYFTKDGDKRHSRMLELLSKASKKGVVRTESRLESEPSWVSDDGQIAAPPPTPRGRKAKQAPVTPVEAATPETAPTPTPPAMESATAPPAPISSAVEPVAEKRPRGVGMRRTTPEGSAMVEAAKQQLRDVINNPDIVGRQRSDMLENGKRLIQFLEANAANPEKMDTGYERGDKVAYTGEQVEPGFRSFIYLEGASAGKEGVAITPEQAATNTVKSQAEYREQQEGFARVAKAQRAEDTKSKRTPPPATGKIGADGWLFDKQSGYSKDISGYKVEVKTHKDAVKDDKYEAVVNGSSIGRFGSAVDAKRYTEANVEAWAEQDMRDQRNASEEEGRVAGEEPKPDSVREVWQKTRKEAGVPPAPESVTVPKYPRLEKIARENPESLTDTDKRLLAEQKAAQKQRAKNQKLHKAHVEASNEHLRAVEAALERGDAVPEAVLDEYPYLRNKASRGPAPADTGTSAPSEQSGKVFYHATNAEGDLLEFKPFTHFGTADAANARLPNKRRYTADSSRERVIPVRLDIRNPLRINDSGGKHSTDDLAYEAYTAGLMSYDEYKNRPDWHTKGALESWLSEKLKASGYDGFVYRNTVEDAGNDSYINIDPSQVKHVLASIPRSADTGIYRDLTAAAREGKRFVAELHERIAPVLERIYAQAKNAVDFVKQAVAKIGKHIRPYAKRFAAEVKRGVRATNAEFRQNPTRGSGPLPSRKQPKAQRESNKAFSAGFNRGQHFGGMRTREEITAFLERASAVLPKEQFAARLKIAKKLLSTDLQSDQKRQDRFNRFIEATRTQVYKAKTISDIAKQSGKLQSAMKKMEPNLKSVVKEVLATFSETKPTDATIQKAEALLMAVADGKTIAHPKAVAAAEKAIDTFLNDKSLASMPLDRLRRLKDTLENMNALHKGNMEQLKEARRELKRQYEQAAKDITDNTETPFEGDEAARKGLIRWVMRDVGMNINNKLLALAPEGSTLHEIAIRMTDAGENRESAHRIEARDYIMGRLAKLKGSDGKPLVVRHPSDDSYALHPEFEAMSLMLSDYANKTPLGKAIARKRGKAPELIGTQLPSGKNIYLTSAERVRLYQLGLDPNARYQITRKGSEGIYLPRKASDKIQKLTPADLTAIEASLTDNEKAIAQAMFEFDNGRAKEAVNEMSRKEFGRDLFAEDDKTSYRRYQHDKEVGSMTEHVGKTFIENQGMLKDITGGTSPIVLGDALSEYFAHQARVAAIVGRMTPSMRLRELASTESFREAVRKSSAQGENALRDIERHFEKYGQISGEQDTAMWAVNGILSRLASAWLGFNPKTIITTPLSAWSMQSRIPTRYLIKNASPRTRDSKVLAEIRKHAPKMYEMMTSSGFSVVSPETTGESAQKFFGKGARGHERAQFFLHEANNIPAIMAWKSAKDWGESQGLTGDALIKFTAEKAQDAYSVSQPDNRWKYTSGAKLDARSSAFWRVATFLQGQTSKQYNQAVEAALAYRYSDRSAAAKAKAVKDMAVPLLGQAILYNAVEYAVMGAKDEWDKMRGEKASRLKDKTAKDFAFDTLRSATENIMIAGPIVSDAADVARRGLRGESPPRVVSGSESALARPLTLAFKLIYQSARAWDKPSKERLTAMRKSIVEAASLMGFDTSIINEALDMAAER